MCSSILTATGKTKDTRVSCTVCILQVKLPILNNCLNVQLNPNDCNAIFALGK